MSQSQHHNSNRHNVVLWAALTLVPLSFLATAEYLPDTITPINPSYLKYFATQSVLIAAILLRLKAPPSTRAHKIDDNHSNQLRHAFPVFLLMFASWNFVSIFWAFWTFGATNTFLHFTTYVALALVFYLTLKTPHEWFTFARIFLVSIIIAAIWQLQATVRAAMSTDNLSLHRAFLKRPFMFGNVNFSCASVITGTLIASGLIIIAIRALWNSESPSTRTKCILQIVGCFAGIVVLTSVLFLAHSLAGYIAAIVAVTAYLLCLIPSTKIRIVLTTTILFCAMLSAMIVLYVPQYRQSAIKWALKRGTTTRARMVWWTASADMFTDRPILGWGVGAYGAKYYRFAPPIADQAPPTRGVAATHPHNEFLRVAAELGIPGLILYCLIFLVTLVTSYRGLRSSSFPTRTVGFAAWAGLLAYLTQASLGKGIHSWDMALPFWILTGSLAAIHQWKCPPGPRVNTSGIKRYVPLFVAPALLFWWYVGGLSGYQSMVRLQKAHNHVNALADYAQHNKASADNERVQKTALKAAEQIDRYITSSRPHCPVITLPLRLRYTLGINLTSLGLNQRGCKQFQKVHAMAPGFVQVEKFLARCKIEKGNNAAAQKLLIQFLDHHPTRTDAYLTLAELDLPAATRHLARQVLERDALSHPERTAMLARMMIALDRWEDLRALLQLAREHADRETYREMGRHIAQFSQQRGKSDNLNKLRESFPNAFPAESKDN